MKYLSIYMTTHHDELKLIMSIEIIDENLSIENREIEISKNFNLDKGILKMKIIYQKILNEFGSKGYKLFKIYDDNYWFLFEKS